MARGSDKPEDRDEVSKRSSEKARGVKKTDDKINTDKKKLLNGVEQPQTFSSRTHIAHRSGEASVDVLLADSTLTQEEDGLKIIKTTPVGDLDAQRDASLTATSSMGSDSYGTNCKTSNETKKEGAENDSSAQLCHKIGQDLIRALSCDSAIVSIFRGREAASFASIQEGGAGFKRAPAALLTASEGIILIEGQRVALPWLVSNLDDAQLTTSVRKRFQGRGISSFVAWELPDGVGWIECHFYSQRSPLSREEFNRLFQICDEGSHALRFLEEGHKVKVNASLANLFTELPCGVVELSNDNRVLYLNRAAHELIGDDKIVSKPFLAAIKPLAEQEKMQELVELEAALCSSSGYQARLKLSIGEISINLLPSEDDHGGSKLLLIWRQNSSDSSNNHLTPQFVKLVEDAHVLVIRADRSLVITDLIGDTVHLLGVEPEHLKRSRQGWINLISRRDLRRLFKRMKASAESSYPIEEEFEILHHRDGTKRAFLVRISTLTGSKGYIQGYEAIAFDITDKRRAQQELLLNKRRLEALNTISDILEDIESPIQVGVLGLKTLMEAVGAHAGFIASVGVNGLEIMATKGLNEDALNLIEQSSLNAPPLSSLLKSRRSLVSENVAADANFEESALSTLGFKSAVFAPIILGDHCKGVVCLFAQARAAFTDYDAQIISSAATQILHALDEIERRLKEREDAQGLAALYRLSSEISRYKHPEQIAKQAFPIIKEVCPYRRIWFGIANEVKSHIMGQAAEGPGIRKQIERVQVELSLRHDFFDQAVETQQPVIVPAGSRAECSGLNRIINALQVETLLIIPLVAVGQLIGVLVVEPIDPSVLTLEKRIPILKSMVGEIATVLLARSYEARIADAEKMRAAGLLASGVAHNFNNLLQAIMGQAAMIQMLNKGSDEISRSAAQILDSSQRGAQIVQHLLAFSKIEREKDAIRLDLVELIKESRTRFSDILGREVDLAINSSVESAPIHGNYQQIMQVLDELLNNAREALATANWPKVSVGVSLQRVTSSATNPDLNPGQYVRVLVEDNGVGMSADQMARCFEPFFTTKAASGEAGLGLTGTGLGLAAAYSIVRAHKGMLSVESEPGKGARFTLLLPVLDDVALRRLASLEEMETVPDVLSVNLAPGSVKGIRQICDSVGLTLLTSDSWNSAIIFSKVAHSQPRLVILDVDNVSFKVAEFIRGLIEEGKRLRLVVLASSTKELEADLAGIERLDLVQKPLSEGTIQNLVRRLFLSRNSHGLQSRIDTSITRGDETNSEAKANLVFKDYLG